MDQLWKATEESDTTDEVEFYYKDCSQHKGISTLLTK